MKISRKKDATPVVSQQQVANVPSSPDAGTLRSGLDEPEYLPEAFERLTVDFGELLARWDRGTLTAQAFAEGLSRLVVREQDGTEWTIGARSGQWYRKGYDGAWNPTLPPEDTGVVQYAYTAASSAARVMLEEVKVLDPVAHVMDVGVPVESSMPHPVVSTTSSNVELPQFRDAGSMIDEHGGWETTFSAVDEPVQPAARLWGLDDLDAGDDQRAAAPWGAQQHDADTADAPTRVWSLRDELEGLGSESVDAESNDAGSTDASSPAAPGSSLDATQASKHDDPWGGAVGALGHEAEEPDADGDDDLGLPPELFG